MIEERMQRGGPNVRQMDQAMEWVQRLSEETTSEQDVNDWLSWYESAEGHRQAFDEMQSFWTHLGEADRTTDFYARLEALQREDNQFSGHEQASHRKSRMFAFLRPAFFGAIAASVLILCFVGLSTYRPILGRGPEISASVGPQHSEEPRVRHTQLPDGSSVDLAARSSLTVQYTPAQRTLMLDKGEAFFSVAPNRMRPFVVRTSAVQVLAIGTKFDVREETDRVVVTVVQGVVDVSPTVEEPADSKSGLQQPIRLNAGNEVTWLKNSGARVVRATAAERALAWRDGRLDYVNEPLSTVVADLNRYSNTRVVIHDHSVETMTYTGTVLLQSIDEWLHAMPSEFPIKVVRDSSQVTLEPLTAVPASMN